MNIDQIAAEAWDTAYMAHNEHTSCGRWAAIDIIKSAIKKAHEDGYRQGAIDGVLNERESRVAHAGEQPEAEFVRANHHPSCTLNDQDLMWVCSQCGLKVPAHASIQFAIEKVRPLIEAEHTGRMLKQERAHASEEDDESKARRTARAIRSIAERAGWKITDDVELAWRDAILYAIPERAA